MEVSSALLGMARTFYVKFWDVLGPDLVSLLNSCLDSGSLALFSAQRHNLIVFKEG